MNDMIDRTISFPVSTELQSDVGWENNIFYPISKTLKHIKSHHEPRKSYT